jgi:hypothetical protein
MDAAAELLLTLLTEAEAALTDAGLANFAAAARQAAATLRYEPCAEFAARLLLHDRALASINPLFLDGTVRGILRDVHRALHQLSREPPAACCGRGR